ncbi:DUF5819 family protein [Thermoactinomyces sp. DSM 45892]|uniref:DUF5819 family protein n=1 Tax=Thermoactinomyces sp. DSM 45892 TaxID=1882753 RepID=UPI0011608960|nr:DUF5819 family protein [Thermoactinomyces sp. DSM 45892]
MMKDNREVKVKCLYGKFSLIVFLFVLLIVHYFVIVLDVGPSNPISIKVNKYTSFYTKTIFAQNWHLFAPDPLIDNQKIYVQIKQKQSSKPGEFEDWIDISTPLIKMNDKSVFTPYNRILRYSDGLVGSFYSGSNTDLVTDVIEKTKDESLKKNLLDKSEESRTEAKTAIYRYASSYALYLTTDPEEIRVKLEATRPQPFSERNTKNYVKKTESNTFEWKKVDKVLPFR